MQLPQSQLNLPTTPNCQCHKVPIYAQILPKETTSSSTELTTSMAKSNQNFTKWLNAKLKELNTDESVFGSYILGIVEGDETNEEKREALHEILSEIIVSSVKVVEHFLNLILTCSPATLRSWSPKYWKNGKRINRRPRDNSN